MHLLIDLQACQTPASRQRGVGRYSLSLARAMAEQSVGCHRVSLLLSDRFPDTVASLRESFLPLVGADNIHIMALPPGCRDALALNLSRTRVAEKLRDQMIRQIRPDVVHVASIFEGFGEDAVSSLESPAGVGPLMVATLYDLIPYLNPEVHLADSYTRRWYLRRLQQLRNADVLLAISESARREALEVLERPVDSVVNISSAIDSHFAPVSLAFEETEALRDRYGLQRPFVLYTGGVGFRKNIEGLIQAFALLAPEWRAGHQLVIVCSIREVERDRLQKLARRLGLKGTDLVFTGYVPDRDLVVLYNLAKLFVFPSFHEGFGLPVLEAMACGTPTIASDRSSLPEVVGLTEALFDPENPESIAALLQRGLEDDDFRTQLSRHGLERATCFSWRESASRALRAIERRLAQHQPYSKSTVNYSWTNKPRLAYVSPLPPQRSGIADYSAALLPELARFYEIELISDESDLSDKHLVACFPVRSSEWFLANSERYHRVLYHVGNSHFHIGMLNLMRCVPGVVMLHDYYLSGMLHHAQQLGLEPAALSRAVISSHGYPALRDIHQMGSSALDRYAANAPVLHGALSVLTHSRYAQQLAVQDYGALFTEKIQRIPFPCRIPAAACRVKARARLKIAPEIFVVCSFGFLTPTKLNLELIQAWQLVGLDNDTEAQLVFVGDHASGLYGEELEELIRNLPNVHITGYTQASDYQDWLAAADLGVQLRSSSRGETSAALFDCLRYGLATVYNAHGSAAELPENIGFRLPDILTVDQLAAALQHLRLYEEARVALSSRAVNFLREEHHIATVAHGYWQAVESAYGDSGLASEAALLDDIATLIAGEGSAWSDQELSAVARCVTLNRRHDLPPPRLYLDISTCNGADLSRLQCLLHQPMLHPWRLECIHYEEGRWRTARNRVAAEVGLSETLPEDDVIPAAHDAWLSVQGAGSHVPPFAWHETPALYLRRTGILDVSGEVAAECLDVWLQDAYPVSATASAGIRPLV